MRRGGGLGGIIKKSVKRNLSMGEGKHIFSLGGGDSTLVKPEPP